MNDRWTEFRELMPVARRWAYLDHSAVAPLPTPTANAIRKWCDEAASEGDSVWQQWYGRVEQLRVIAARMINAAPTEIALLPSTTAGINVVAEGFPWQHGDTVVTIENEFSSNLYPWINLASRGVTTHRVPTERGEIDWNRVADHCDARTKIVSVSWVGYSSGWRIDLDAAVAVAHDRNALLFVDGIQGLGVFPIDVARTPVDFLAADGHKWMLGPEGAGIFYIRREHLDLLRPIGVGWHSVKRPFDFGHGEMELRHEAARYEGGSLNMCGFLGLAASLELLANMGLTPNASPIAERVLATADRAVDLLEAAGARMISRPPREHRSGIITFEVPDQNPAAVRQTCLDAKIALSCRGGGVRISPHAYNNEADLERLVEAIRNVPGKG